MFNTINLHAQYPFRTTYQFTGNNCLEMVHATTPDGGSIMVANLDDGNLNTYFSILKTDSVGTIQWARTFGPVDGEVQAITVTPDSGYFFCYPDLNSQHAYHAVKIDANGTIVFTSYLDLPSTYMIPYVQSRVVVRNNGGFYIATPIIEISSQFWSWHLFALDATGNVTWSNLYNTAVDKSVLNGIDTCSNGDIMLLGEYLDSTMNYGVMLSRISPSGSQLWSKNYTHAGYFLLPRALAITQSGSIYITATKYTSPADFVLMKLDSTANELWTYRYSIGMSIEPDNMMVAENENILMFYNNNVESFLLKTDSSGAILSARRYPSTLLCSIDTIGTTGYSFCGFIQNTWDGVLLSTDLNGHGCKDTNMVFTKTAINVVPGTFSGEAPVSLTQSISWFPQFTCDALSTDDCGPASIADQVHLPEITLSPNPSASLVEIHAGHEITSVEIIDLNGKVLHHAHFNSMSAEIDLSGYDCGVYLLRIHSGDETSIQRVVVSR